MQAGCPRWRSSEKTCRRCHRFPSGLQGLHPSLQVEISVEQTDASLRCPPLPERSGRLPGPAVDGSPGWSSAPLQPQRSRTGTPVSGASTTSEYSLYGSPGRHGAPKSRTRNGWLFKIFETVSTMQSGTEPGTRSLWKRRHPRPPSIRTSLIENDRVEILTHHYKQAANLMRSLIAYVCGFGTRRPPQWVRSPTAGQPRSPHHCSQGVTA